MNEVGTPTGNGFVSVSTRDRDEESDCDDETPIKGDVLEIHSQPGATNFQTFANTFIAFVGSGLMGMPYAFQSVGVGLGCLVMVAIGGVSVWCMLKLLEAKKKANETFNVKSYGDVAWLAGGNVAFGVIQGSLVLTQTGFCCAYLVFIMENTRAVLSDVPPTTILIMCLAILMPVVLLRHLKFLAPFSMFANMTNLSALGVVYVVDFMVMGEEHEQKARYFKPEGLTYFFGVAVYCYEGIGMVIPLEDSMKAKEDFSWVLVGTMLLVSAVFLTFGMCGYMAFKDDTEGIVTLNLPGGVVSNFVQTALCCGLLFTYPIMMFPVSEIMDDTILNPTNPYHVTKQNLGRLGLVLFTGVVAVSIPDFGLFISLVGSSCCSILAFIMPAFLHYKLCKDDLSSFSIASDWVIILFGIFAAVVSTWQSVENIRAALS